MSSNDGEFDTEKRPNRHVARTKYSIKHASKSFQNIKPAVRHKSYESEYENPDLYVTVKCNKCGAKQCFYPHRVQFLECECGNLDYGNSIRDWPKGLFGDHTLVQAQIWHLPSMWELCEQTINERRKDKEH